MLIPDNLGLLPKDGVSKFVSDLANHNRVPGEMWSKRSKFDDWASAITACSGDDVKLDETQRILLALKKKKLIGARQAARLLMNHAREKPHV